MPFAEDIPPVPSPLSLFCHAPAAYVKTNRLPIPLDLEATVLHMVDLKPLTFQKSDEVGYQVIGTGRITLFRAP